MQLWLIPILPLLGFLINGLLGRRFSKGLVTAVAIGSVALSFVWALRAILALDLDHAYVEHYFTWIQSGAFRVNCDFSVDRLTAVMLMVVAAAEAAVGLAIILTVFKNRGTLQIEEVDSMKN